MIERVKSSFGILEKYYSTFVFEDYLDMFVDEMKSIKEHDEQYLFTFFQDYSNAERFHHPFSFHCVLHDMLTAPLIKTSIVLFLRFLTSAELRTKGDSFVHFLPDGFADITHYCSSEVETMGRESEEIHIVALATFLQVNVRVAHLDQSATESVNFHDYTFSPDTQEPFITILYRPGHYDLIYK